MTSRRAVFLATVVFLFAGSLRADDTGSAQTPPVSSAPPPRDSIGGPLYGVKPDGFFENLEGMKKLQERDPAFYAVTRKRADGLKKAFDDAISARGSSFGGFPLRGDDERAVRAAFEKFAHRESAGDAKGEPALSGSGIPSQISFRGHKRGRAPER